MRIIQLPVFSRRRLLFIVGGCLLIALLAGGAGVIYWNGINPEKLNDVETIKSKISHHMILPTDEEPALATVTDSTRLKTDFFRKSKNGDKILIYQKNSRAIIYRPSIDRIIDVGPVNIDEPPKSETK